MLRIILTTLFALAAQVAVAAEFGTKEEAMALVEKAVAHVTKVGPEKGFADISDPKGPFVDRDLYVFVADETGVRVAHGFNAKLIGKSLADAKDVNGKPYGQEIMELAKSKSEGWVDYMFSDPTTKKLSQKSSYVKKVGAYTYAVGIYVR